MAEELKPEGAWQDLLEKDDRTSPEEYPEMALITFEELRDYMQAGRAPPSPEMREAVALIIDPEAVAIFGDLSAIAPTDPDDPRLFEPGPQAAASAFAKADAILNLLQQWARS